MMVVLLGVQQELLVLTVYEFMRLMQSDECLHVIVSLHRARAIT